MIAADGKPLDYVDDQGVQHIMCACGHRVSGTVKVGDKIDLCPNCSFLLRFNNISVVYPSRLPPETLPDGWKVIKNDKA